MQRQVSAAERSLAAAEASQRGIEEQVGALEMRLSAAEERARVAEQAAGRAQAQAASEVRKLEALARQVRLVAKSAKAAIAEVGEVLAQLPAGSGTKERLLAMQLGVAASSKELELSSTAAAAPGSEAREEGSVWLPKVGEDVLVRTVALNTSFRFLRVKEEA
jgi:predicted  nucleic acid-binding Zn-ribbon protein